MSRTLVRQDDQIHPSGTYTDNIAPTLANFETNTTDAEDDFNNVRSQLHNLLKVQGGNWYDDLNVPVTFTGEGEVKRGVNNLNSDLHDIERKRILRRRQVVAADITVDAAVQAAGNLLINSVPGAGETVTIDTKTYTFVVALVAEGDVLIEVTAAGCRDNLVNAINHGAGAGVKYQAVAAHPTVSAAIGAGDSLDATALKYGTAGNLIATTEGLVDVLSVWGAVTLTGGDGDVVVLDGGASELPGNTTAAVGAVTTRGTVVASVSGSFDQAATTEVAGGDTLTPKNICKIADSATGEIIVDGDGNEIHALLQSEFAADGTTITLITPNRVQLSFVVHNVTNDDLILVDGLYIGGKTIDYSPIERYAFEDIPEHAWLGDTDFIDAGSGAVDRQDVYNNQGIVPVDLITNAVVDLEGAGITWTIRDDLEVILFQIIEGSAGGTSEIAFGSDVDIFDNDAVLNDFANALRVSTSGVDIHIGVTAGHIETIGAADDLHIQSSRELFFDDVNQTGSTWAQTDGIKLSETTAEWDAFESVFGEVSLLNAIVQAVGAVTRCKTVAVVGGAAAADIAANTLIQGPGGPGVDNISADLCDYDALTFVDEVDIYINGVLQWNGVNAAANNDVYPSAVAAERQVGAFYSEYVLRHRGGLTPDVITMIAWG